MNCDGLARMPGGDEGRSGCISMKQLVEVFKLCDREHSGRIRVEYLQDLAKGYIGDSQVSPYSLAL